MSTDPDISALLRSLPALTKLLSNKHAIGLCECYGEGLFKYEARILISAIRNEILENKRLSIPTDDELVATITQSLMRKRSATARSALNATGVLLHTNLGRAPIAKNAVDLISATAGYGVVQINLEDNSRSKRDEEIVSLLQTLTGCQAATVVNNNAAATFLILNALVAGREVIISRGQLVEIGGSFRMPDVIAQSGVIMKEVGTTNKTHLKDYESAITTETGALLYVEPSNYQVIGFSGFPTLEELCTLGKKHNIPVIADLGSGALVPTEKYGIKHSLTIAEALAVGAAITCSSGDKLVGGPQAGIICGQKDIVAKIRKSPFARMFRVDKLTLTGIEATLQEFVNDSFEENIPFYQMLSKSVDSLREDASKLSSALRTLSANYKIEVIETNSFVGGGTLPEEKIESIAVSIKPKSASAESLAKKLRLNQVPIFCRIEEEALIFDMRSLLDGHLEILINQLPRLLVPGSE